MAGTAEKRMALGAPAPDGMRYYLSVTPPARAEAAVAYEVTIQSDGAVRRRLLKPTLTIKVPTSENQK